MKCSLDAYLGFLDSEIDRCPDLILVLGQALLHGWEHRGGQTATFCLSSKMGNAQLTSNLLKSLLTLSLPSSTLSPSLALQLGKETPKTIQTQLSPIYNKSDHKRIHSHRTFY